MRRLFLALAALALVATACGGSTSSATSGASASELLASVKPATGPQKIDASMSLNIDGAPASAGAAGALLTGPIDLKVAGVTDSATNAADVDVSIALGPLDVTGKVRSDGTHAWLQYGGDWYDLGTLSSVAGIANSATGGAAPNVDPTKLRALVGDPAKLIKNPTIVGDEDAAGVPSTHVTGSLDLAAFSGMVSQAAASSSTTPATTQASITELEQALKQATFDVWIGKDDHQVHRAVAHIVVDTSQIKSMSGMRGATVALDVTTAGTGPVNVSPPPNPKSLSELEQAITGGLMPGLSGSLGTTTP